MFYFVLQEREWVNQDWNPDQGVEFGSLEAMKAARVKRVEALRRKGFTWSAPAMVRVTLVDSETFEVFALETEDFKKAALSASRMNKLAF